MEHKLFVGNIPYECTKNDFKNIFKKYKGYKSADLINDNNKCFGFVIFENKNSLEDVLLSNNVFIKDRKLRLTRYNDKNKETNNYIKLSNIPSKITVDDIREEFENYSEVGKCFIDMDRITGKYKSTGIVEILESDIYNQLIDLDIILINEHQINLSPYKTDKFDKTDKTDNNKYYKKI
jgi:RNA recognition motif-containing protein